MNSIRDDELVAMQNELRMELLQSSMRDIKWQPRNSIFVQAVIAVALLELVVVLRKRHPCSEKLVP